MALRKFKKFRTDDDKLNQIQSNVESVTTPLISSAIIDGVIIKEIEIKALNVALVQHKLGREAIGWILIRQREDARVWDIQDMNVNKSTTIALTSSHDVVVDLWVF